MSYLIGEQLSGGYGGGADIIRDCTISVDKGQISVVVGPNGAGKSTAMKALLGMLNLREGRVLLDGQVVGKGWLLVDRHTDPCHPRRVRHRQVMPVVDLGEGDHLDLAALMHVEGPVMPVEDLHPVLVLDGTAYGCRVVLVTTVDHPVVDQ